MCIVPHHLKHMYIFIDDDDDTDLKMYCIHVASLLFHICAKI